jgi:hypothetical protein
MSDGIDCDMSEVVALAGALAAAGPAMAATTETIINVEAEAVRADASRRAPVLTGAQAAGYFVEDAGEGAKRITNNVREAFYQEVGTSKMGPQPALFPAADAGEVRLVAKLEAAAGEVTL